MLQHIKTVVEPLVEARYIFVVVTEKHLDLLLKSQAKERAARSNERERKLQ